LLFIERKAELHHKELRRIRDMVRYIPRDNKSNTLRTHSGVFQASSP
jgi:hypothetical protein